MSRRLALVWALLLLCWAGPMAHAQSPLSSSVVPTRTALSRLGLERQWINVAPIAGTERILKIGRGKDLLVVLTNLAMLHVYDAETGRPLWSAQIGESSRAALGASENSYAVFVTSANIMTALDRKTGRVIWRENLDTLPSSASVANDDQVLVGMSSGMVHCYNLREKQEKGPDKIREKPELAWKLATGGEVRTRPLLADQFVCIGSSDGKVSVDMVSDATPLFRVVTGGPIGRDMASYGTRTLLIPSADQSLYAVDVFTSKISWVFPSGAPIEQGPIVAREEIFVINDAGGLTVLDPKTGVPRWTTSTDSGRLLGASPTKVYLFSQDNDLMIVDRASGKLLQDPAATYQRAGLNLRDFELSFPSRFDDRLYMATPSGVIVCLREIGQNSPALLRDPKAEPFGQVPPEGIKELPNPFQEAPDDANAEAPAEEPLP